MTQEEWLTELAKGIDAAYLLIEEIYNAAPVITNANIANAYHKTGDTMKELNKLEWFVVDQLATPE